LEMSSKIKIRIEMRTEFESLLRGEQQVANRVVCDWIEQKKKITIRDLTPP